MVHHRLNEKESNPNPHVNFISPLPCADSSEQESARQLLRALAAQVRPIMKSHGFSVNSFEEVRRTINSQKLDAQPDLSMSTTMYLQAVTGMLAKLLHMNHGPAFQALWKRLRVEVRALQDKGYYGDGYWSSGTRLADSVRVNGQGIEPGDLPEYVCGGAQTRQRPTASRARKPRKPRNTTVTPSNSTGRQTAKPRKAGARITSKTAFNGEGSSLVDNAAETKGKGTGFGKQANSKRAREERALATERRLLALQSQAKTSSRTAPRHSDESETGSDDEEGVDVVPETDTDRREALLSSDKKEDWDVLKSGSLWEHFEKDFDFGGSQGRSPPEGDRARDSFVAPGTTNRALPVAKGKRKAHADSSEDDEVGTPSNYPST
ncbi:hypothetical protein DXG01_005239 [Tephrocybe rancida]|nr:hypothetical protein DXG01_005239 [Tephrocybe rancida]